eukprot:5497627-Pyramimonas_sp.AAC.1
MSVSSPTIQSSAVAPPRGGKLTEPGGKYTEAGGKFTEAGGKFTEPGVDLPSRGINLPSRRAPSRSFISSSSELRAQQTRGLRAAGSTQLRPVDGIRGEVAHEGQARADQAHLRRRVWPEYNTQ